MMKEEKKQYQSRRILGFKAVADRSGFFSCSRIGFYPFCPVQQGRIRKSLAVNN